MRLFLLVLSAALANAVPQEIPWSPPGPNDVRSPCPVLNALANHDILQHNGKDITEQDTIRAMDALHVDKELSETLFAAALKTNLKPNATTYSLDDLDHHNIIEHDGSLSRGDYYFGDNHSFNQTLFDQVKSYWTEPLIDLHLGAKARLAGVNRSKATNPTFDLSGFRLRFSYAQTATYILVFGDKISGTVNKTWIEYLFEKERLPVELGWEKRENIITTADLDSMIERVMKATKEIETLQEA
ncbi:Chloroperoxidase [Aspergillus caelatus]|uniref:Chloroperoxidase n=1 Tax=Aspergillus caelatus TaxID=61420 RepID=A0A5N7A3T7_9EURO|nr:Chloroperoxidase [Aspergillus caelatus]KAE8363170.1 Chloroperoxidase [Aspergillus caelatus]